MEKELVNSSDAPEPIGSYSQAVKSGGFLYLSGQIALNPKTMEMATGGIKEESRQVLKNIGEVLKAGGADFNSVVKTTVYLSDMSQFAEMNEVYAEFFGESKPARATVEVSSLPKNGLVEIDAIAKI